MGNINSKINLSALKDAAIITSGKNKDVDCILIPIERNHLYRTDKGAVYLDLIGFELKTKKEDSKDTHMIKQSLPKEVREKQTQEEQRAMPILGNHIVWDGTGQSQSEPATAKVATDTDDLPF